MNTTHFTSLLAMFTTPYNAVITTPYKYLPSWQFRTVSILCHPDYVRSAQRADHISYAADREDKDANAFRMFKRQLYHTSLSSVLDPLRPGTTKPEVLRCPDAHYRRAIYGIAAHLMDYPEQAQAACIVEGWCPV